MKAIYAVLLTNLMKDERKVHTTFFKLEESSKMHAFAREWLISQGTPYFTEDCGEFVSSCGEVYAEFFLLEPL